MAASVFARDSRPDGSGQAIAQMNVTPLVDVMLVLLIIFMVAAPLVTRTLEIGLPQTPTWAPPVQPQRLDLRVHADGRYVLDGAVLGERALRAALEAAARRAPASTVAITVSEHADYQAFTTALAAVRDSGLDNISLGH